MLQCWLRHLEHTTQSWLFGQLEKKKMISPGTGYVARMVLLTNLNRDRCQYIIESTRDEITVDLDLYLAIRKVEAYGEVPPIVTRRALLAVLMRTISDVAQIYLDDTATDLQSIQRAILRMKTDRVNQSHATMALMRLYTSLPKRIASRYLTRAGAQGLEVAIELAGEDGHIGKRQALVARLQARFEIDKKEAEHYADHADVKGDYNRAVQRVSSRRADTPADTSYSTDKKTDALGFPRKR
ncbi:MAG: hypothetical protein Q9214_006250 [Letrouitia sp. 1 TL-2023]